MGVWAGKSMNLKLGKRKRDNEDADSEEDDDEGEVADAEADTAIDGVQTVQEEWNALFASEVRLNLLRVSNSPHICRRVLVARQHLYVHCQALLVLAEAVFLKIWLNSAKPQPETQKQLLFFAPKLSHQ